jgi:predicted MFS family arabinose efflux permease
MSFQFQHISLLLRYSGISGVAGAVNHGFFSEERSYITAIIGVALYVIGAFMDHRNHPDESDDWRSLFGFGIVSSIGLGFFTGGIQHFPDSPERSMWVVPLGFVMSLIAFYMLEGREKTNLRSLAFYGILGTVVVLAACWGAWEAIDHLGGVPHSHSH